MSGNPYPACRRHMIEASGFPRSGFGPRSRASRVPPARTAVHRGGIALVPRWLLSTWLTRQSRPDGPHSERGQEAVPDGDGSDADLDLRRPRDRELPRERFVPPIRGRTGGHSLRRFDASCRMLSSRATDLRTGSVRVSDRLPVGVPAQITPLAHVSSDPGIAGSDGFGYLAVFDEITPTAVPLHRRERSKWRPSKANPSIGASLRAGRSRSATGADARNRRSNDSTTDTSETPCGVSARSRSVRTASTARVRVTVPSRA